MGANVDLGGVYSFLPGIKGRKVVAILLIWADYNRRTGVMAGLCVMAIDQKRMMKQLIIIVLLTFVSVLTYGQTNSDKRKSVFLEIAGSGGLGSLNFERHFFRRSITEFTWRAGLSFAPIDKNNGTGIVFPLMINTLIGKNSHKLELGLGQGITITTKGNFFALTTAAVGYRYQSESKRLFYRVTYTPLISYLVDFQIQHWAGVSIGYTFKHKAK